MSGEYYTTRDGQSKQGPFSAKQLRRLAGDGQLQPTDLIWKEGLPSWVPASRLKGLFPVSEDKPTQQVSPAPQVQWSLSVLPPRQLLEETFDWASINDPGNQSSFPDALNEHPSRLIACSACGHQIAIEAKICPSCGAPNKWVHPEIQRFIASAHSFDHMPSFHYSVPNGMMLKGTAKREKGSVALGNLAGKLFAIGALALVLGSMTSAAELIVLLGGLAMLVSTVLFLVSMLQEVKPTDLITSFAIDFNQSPPSWVSDDEEFWRDIRRFFGA